MGKRTYSYFDLFEEEKYEDDLFPACIHSLFYSKNRIEDLKKMHMQN
jgi:hypothetical protein